MATGNDPFADLLTLQRDMDRIMTRFGAEPRRAGEDGHSFWMPPVDVYKQGDAVIVRVEVPGMSPAEIGVSVTGNMLTIKGERRQEQRIDDNDYVMRESTFGSFERRVTLPRDIDAGGVRAQYKAGVLEVTVPGSALIMPQTQRVQIAAGQQPTGGQTRESMGAEQTYPGEQPYQPAGQQPYQPAGQQPYQQAGQQPATGQGMGEEQPAAGAAGAPAQPQGGWVTPEEQTPPQRREGERPREERQRSRLGSWLHGSED